MVTAAYVALVGAVAIQRMLEVRVSRLNEAELRARGGREHAPGQMPVMIALHTIWLVCALAEVLLLDRPFIAWLGLPALFVFCVGQTLRLLAITALASRWTVKIITVPDEPAVHAAIFRHVRHPNYLGVILEVAALPLVHTAWLTAVFFSIANGLLLKQRIRAEEKALCESSDYATCFEGRPRFLPKLAGESHPHASEERGY